MSCDELYLFHSEPFQTFPPLPVSRQHFFSWDMSCSVFVWMTDSGMALKAGQDILSDYTPGTQQKKSVNLGPDKATGAFCGYVQGRHVSLCFSMKPEDLKKMVINMTLN